MDTLNQKQLTEQLQDISVIGKQAKKLQLTPSHQFLLGLEAYNNELY
jgi:hypothetical protein